MTTKSADSHVELMHPWARDAKLVSGESPKSTSQGLRDWESKNFSVFLEQPHLLKQQIEQKMSQGFPVSNGILGNGLIHMQITKQVTLSKKAVREKKALPPDPRETLFFAPQWKDYPEHLHIPSLGMSAKSN